MFTERSADDCEFNFNFRQISISQINQVRFFVIVFIQLIVIFDRHENMVQYLDLLRGKHERTTIVSEHFGITNASELTLQDNFEPVIKIFYQCSLGLSHIHKQQVVHHFFEPKNIQLDEYFNVKIFNYGLYYSTRGIDDEKFASFPIGHLRYMSPERILGNHGNPKR